MASDDMKRLLIVTTALTEVAVGSHYLKGADGGVPGGASGLSRTPSLLENLSIDSLGVHAAQSDFGTCRGRWALMKAQGGRQFATGNADRDTVLPQYLADLMASGLPPSLWAAFKDSDPTRDTGLFPRRSKGYLFLGEDCRGRRHFDCEGFIAWVLVKAISKDAGTWRKGVKWYQDGGSGRLDVYQASGDQYAHSDGSIIRRSDIRDGDILIRKPNEYGGEHIAFACAGGSAVLEASGKDRGAQRSPYKSNWTQLARIKDL